MSSQFHVVGLAAPVEALRLQDCTTTTGVPMRLRWEKVEEHGLRDQIGVMDQVGGFRNGPSPRLQSFPQTVEQPDATLSEAEYIRRCAPSWDDSHVLYERD